MTLYDVNDGLKMLNVIGITLNDTEEEIFRRNYLPSPNVVISTQLVYASIAEHIPVSHDVKTEMLARRIRFCELFNTVDRRSLKVGIDKGVPLDRLLGELESTP